jgi:hypothetical protein
MTTPHGPAFAELVAPEKDGVPLSLSEPIKRCRDHLPNLLVPLRGKIAEIRARADLSDSGKHDLIRQTTQAVLIDSTRALDSTAATARNFGGSATQALSQRLYGNPNPVLLGAIQDTLLALAPRDLAIPDLATDGEGRAVLGGSGLLTLIRRTIESTPLASAGNVVQAVAKLDPIHLTLLGGEKVIAGARRVLEVRAAAEDAEVAALIEVRRLGTTAESIVHGDRSAVTKFVSEISGLPVVTLDTLTPKAATRAA